MQIRDKLQNTSSWESDLCHACTGQLILDPDSGEEVCSSCGIVAQDNLEMQIPERRAFTMEEMEKRTRVGEPTSLMMYDMGLSSFIDSKNIDANGKQINRHFEIERLRRLNKITLSNNSKTKNLNKAMREIRRITEILGIGMPVAERAAYIYRKAFEKGLIKGRSITGIVAAAVYIACKDTGTPRSISEIQDVIGNVDRKNIGYYYKFLLREMKINVPIPLPAQNISRIADKARLSEKSVRRALEILSHVGGNALMSGKNPVSLAAAALYMASLDIGEYTTQLRVAIAADVSTVTVRKRCLEIIELLKNTDFKSSRIMQKSQEFGVASIRLPLGHAYQKLPVITESSQRQLKAPLTPDVSYKLPLDSVNVLGTVVATCVSGNPVVNQGTNLRGLFL